MAEALRAPAFAGWCLGWLVIAWAMLHPAPPAMPGLSDKLVHFASFLVVSVVAVTFCRTTRQLLLAGGFCAVAGILLELAQGLTRARLFEWGDLAANLLGTVVGIALAALLLHLLQGSRRVPRAC